MPNDMPLAVEPRPVEVSSRAGSHDAADRCVSLRRAQSRTRATLALTIAAFTRIDGPRWLAYASQRDYARGRLEIPWATFARHHRLGSFLVQCPDVLTALEAGDLSFSTTDELALRADPATASRLLPRLVGHTVRHVRAILEDAVAGSVESERRTTLATDETQPNYERVSFSVPPTVAHYLHQSLELASALEGSELSESDCVEAVAAEASTEIPLTESAGEARHRFRAPRRRVTPKSRPVALPKPPRPHFRQGDRRAALILDRRLKRLIERRNRLETDLEDALLELHTTEQVSLRDFARDVLDLPRSTLSDYLQRARQRRFGDPIARALAHGRMTPVKAQLLHRLRRCHVPVSCLGPWIDLAQRCTTRRLDRAVRWARMQGDLDYRAWALDDYPPPTSDQLRTSNQPLEAIAADPRPEWLLEAEQTPQTTVTWVLAEETLDLLLQLMATVENQHHERAFEPVPPWWCLLQVFATARKEWSVIERRPNTITRRILGRDGYRCTAPHCSQRRNLQVHHIRFKSAGGGDDEANLITLCAFHHAQAVHQNLMRVRGRAIEGADDLTFELGLDANGRPTEAYRREEAFTIR